MQPPRAAIDHGEILAHLARQPILLPLDEAARAGLLAQAQLRVLRGLRIRVRDVLDLLGAGASREEILADYPMLDAGDIAASLDDAARPEAGQGRKEKTVPVPACGPVPGPVSFAP